MNDVLHESISNSFYSIEVFSVLGTNTEQEDAVGYVVKDTSAVLVICDGMGGMNGGRISAQTAVQKVKELAKNEEWESRPLYFIKKALEIADEEVYYLKNNKGERICGGCTIVIGIIIGRRLYYANVGDSRIYYFNGKVLNKITQDHNYGEELKRKLKRGEIGDDEYSLENVNITDLTINSNWGVTNNGQIICMGAAVYGECVLKNCVMTGLKIDGPKNSDGKYINQNGLVVNDYFDLVVVNNISATIDGGEYGKMYTYEHAKTTIKGDVKIANLTTRTLSVSGGKLVIEGGTIEKITVIPVGKYVPTIVVGPGATVKEIDFGGAKATGFPNNSGKEITIKNVAE